MRVEMVQATIKLTNIKEARVASLAFQFNPELVDNGSIS